MRFAIPYRGGILRTHFRADFLCEDTLVLEIKALREITGLEEAQILNYLKASGKPTGLLLNFGTARLTYRRFIWTRDFA